MLLITCNTPEDPGEPRLNLKQVREALAPKLGRRPDVKTVYNWLALPEPMPCKILPGTGQGPDGRNVRRFLLSHVLAWLDDPQAYYGRKRRAS